MNDLIQLVVCHTYLDFDWHNDISYIPVARQHLPALLALELAKIVKYHATDDDTYVPPDPNAVLQIIAVGGVAWNSDDSDDSDDSDPVDDFFTLEVEPFVVWTPDPAQATV